MTELLERVFAALERLPEVEQQDYAERIGFELFRNVEQAEPFVQYTPEGEPVKADWP